MYRICLPKCIQIKCGKHSSGNNRSEKILNIIFSSKFDTVIQIYHWRHRTNYIKTFFSSTCPVDILEITSPPNTLILALCCYKIFYVTYMALTKLSEIPEFV